ncbi:MAG: DUF4365 domain-containing protein [Lewinellaceae bacterium]|nr:DUF4365 domain-containing protein [Saprospiraceae bacterium]MCB9338257.1 DUF4365 domain-containing protein [Lewinellaceae bacterium]
MTEAIKKEEFSLQLFATLAAQAGYKSVTPRVDDGIDMMINPSRELVVNQKPQRAPSSNFIGIQMKTTTQKQVRMNDDCFRFYLRGKNYNDLIALKNDWYSADVFGIPLLLLVHLLPDNEEDWIQVDLGQQFYKMNGLFYWFYPARDDNFTNNPSQHPIKVPLGNRVGLDFFNNIFNLFF